MKAKAIRNLSQPKKAMTEKMKQDIINNAHERGLIMDARYTANQNLPSDDSELHYPSAAKRGCQKKKKFSTADAASKSAAESMSKIFSSDALRVYLCDQCEKWHITKKTLQYFSYKP